MLASSHTSVLINHCSAQLRMHTRATTFLGRVLLVGWGWRAWTVGIGTASNDTRATRHTGPHTRGIDAGACKPTRSPRMAPSRGRATGKTEQGERGVGLCTWRFGLADGDYERKSKTSVALCSCCYCCLGLPLSSFFCCYFHILGKKIKT